MDKGQYVPALGYSWLTRFYDPVVALTCRERTFRQRLVELGEVQAGAQVLDLACGTGTFAVMLKKHCPEATVTALDGDPGILQIARAKARDAGVDVQFEEGLSSGMPFVDETFDAVFTSLFFHHLQTDEKLQTMREVRRVLKPGGVFFICDWGPASGSYAKLAFTLVRMLDGFEVTLDNVEGRLPGFLRQAGFDPVRECGVLTTVLGTLHFMAAGIPLEHD